LFFAHITAATKEIIASNDNSLINCHELSKRIVSEFVYINVPYNKRNFTSDAENAATTENTINDSVYLHICNKFAYRWFILECTS